MIKTILKRNNILLSQFANDLNISRPTLDSYIKSYDRGTTLSNNLYQRIFDFLFADIFISNEEFNKKYEYIVNNYGNSKSVLISKPSTTPIPTSYSSIEERKLVELIKNKDELLFCLLKYHLLFESPQDIDTLNDKEKMICESFYKTQNKIKNHDFSLDEQNFQSFKDEINKKNIIQNKDELLTKISAKLTAIVDEALKNNNEKLINDLLTKLNIN